CFVLNKIHEIACSLSLPRSGSTVRIAAPLEFFSSAGLQRMAMTTSGRAPWWSWAGPIAAWLVLVLGWMLGPRGAIEAAAGVALVVTVFAAVYHAEIVAHRVGEPFGTIVLAVAVTVIEVALIVSMMLGSGPEKASLARDTVFAAVMIVCNGVVGLCLLAGGARHREQG